MADDYVADEADAAGESLRVLAEGPAKESADLIAASFREAGREIEDALTSAARTGEFSFKAMAAAISAELSSLAIERFVRAPLNSLTDGLLGALPFSGARAEGGPVVPGGAYLVGERGPEMFRPASAGEIGGATAPNVTVNVTLPSGGMGARMSENELAARIARAAARGARRL